MSKYLLAIPLGIILVIFFKGGEIINCLLISFKVMYSSKSIRNSLMSRGTFTRKVSILLPITFGGMVSFAPPTGEPTRAQEINSKEKRKRKRIFFIDEF